MLSLNSQTKRARLVILPDSLKLSWYKTDNYSQERLRLTLNYSCNYATHVSQYLFGEGVQPSWVAVSPLSVKGLPLYKEIPYYLYISLSLSLSIHIYIYIEIYITLDMYIHIYIYIYIQMEAPYGKGGGPGGCRAGPVGPRGYQGTAEKVLLV